LVLHHYKIKPSSWDYLSSLSLSLYWSLNSRPNTCWEVLYHLNCISELCSWTTHREVWQGDLLLSKRPTNALRRLGGTGSVT
jgi:hypothetical protein